MINDFPFIYKDELLYSVLGRYHLTDGDKNIKRMFENLFEKPSIIPVIEIPCNIENLCNNIPQELEYNSDFIILNCTLFPLYSPFMSKEKRQGCMDIIKYNDGKGLKYKIGIIAGGICPKNNIYYCPECVKFEVENYEESYIHRIHQVQGIFICEKHLCKLKEYKEVKSSRLQFRYIDNEKIEDKPEFIKDNLLLSRFIKISNEVKYLLENDLSIMLNQEIILQRYYKILFEKGYLTEKNRVKQSKLMSDIIEYYGNDFLEVLNSKIDINNECNWLKTLFHKRNRVIHPIRHILLIDYLIGSIEQFIKYEEKLKVYPCLNRWCKNYKEAITTKIIITADYKTRELVATVNCEECGFTYSRKVKKDAYEIGRIKNFGPIWLNKLVEVINSCNSLSSMAEEMGCDCKTIVKYAEKLGYRYLISSNMKVMHSINKMKPKFNNAEKYKENIINFTKESPTASITTIRMNNSKEYTWLYKNERVWLKENLPNLCNKREYKNTRVNWNKRDLEIFTLLKEAYCVLKDSKLPCRITKTLLARKIGKLACLEKQIDKMPLCKKYLESVHETVEEYQIRRVDFVCFDMYMKNDNIAEWKIKRIAGLKKNISNLVQERIANNIERYTYNNINYK